MTREELLDLVNGKVDTTKFKSLSKKTINEEVDDVLEDMGDDESVNDKVVTKLANRLKRMDGNLHKNVSDEMKKNKEAEEQRKKEEEEAKKQKEDEENNHSESDDLIKKLTERLDAMEKANNERAAKAAKEATMDAVKKGLKDKFEKAGLELNNFFAKTALSKLDVSGENVDVNELIAKAEKLYNADVKDAGYVPNSKPHNGGGDGNPQDDDKIWDDIASLRKRD
jgi:hypothetical protein